jgi:hypothetical protein
MGPPSEMCRKSLTLTARRPGHGGPLCRCDCAAPAPFGRLVNV